MPRSSARDILNYMEKSIADLRIPLLRASRVLSAKPEDTLDKAFSKTESSHEGVFVFDREEHFLGIVCPAFSLFKSRASYQAHVSSALFRPPSIVPATRACDLARLMLSTRCYTLPVHGNRETIRGAVTARALIRAVLRDESVRGDLVGSIEPEPTAVLPRDATAQRAYALLRGKGTTRVLLVSARGRLEGIISRRDIQAYLTKPTTLQRLKTGGKGPARNFISGREPKSRLNFPALSIASRNVLALGNATPMGDILSVLARSRRSSVVLLDAESRPSGIISLRTALKGIADLERRSIPPVSLYDGARLPEGDAEHIRKHLERFAEKLRNRMPLTRIDAFLKAPRNAAGRPLSFLITLEAVPRAGNPTIAKAEHRDLLRCLAEAERKIERQVSDAPS